MKNTPVHMEYFVKMQKDGYGFSVYDNWIEQAYLFDPFTQIGNPNRVLIKSKTLYVSELKYLEYFTKKPQHIVYSLN